MTTTRITHLEVRYTRHLQTRPDPKQVMRLDDGRILVRTEEGEETLYDGFGPFGADYPHYEAQASGTSESYDAPSIKMGFMVHVDWAEVHHLMSNLDRARRGTRIGRDGVTDAFGGAYSPGPNTLPKLLRLLTSVDRCAHDAWSAVHKACNRGQVEDARQACRVAVACAAAFEMFGRAGLIDNASRRICGCGPGYGLTGLQWLAGKPGGDLTCEQVDRFIAGESPEALFRQEDKASDV